MQEYTQGITYFIKLIIKWKKYFIIVTVLAVLISALFSSKWFIKPKYKSFAIVYPSNLIQYSTESKSEQMMQLFESADIRNSVIRKFNLADHYKINTARPAGFSELIAEYESNVSVTRTDYESILIKVMDTDPKLACDMVKEIMNALNQKARSLQRDKSKEILKMQQHQLADRKKELDSVNLILQNLRINYHLLDYQTQVKEFTKGYIKTINASGNSNYKEIDQMINSLQQKGGEFYTMARVYESILNSYNATKMEYDNTLTDLNKELTYISEVTSPIIADKKSYPIRWLIILVSVLSADLFLFVMLLMIEKKSIIN
jgi:capsular polysaccharide biosynthesis protein